MRTQETFSLMKSAKEIAVAIVTDGDRIGGRLNEINPLPVEEGEPAFDYRKHMQSLGLQLEEAQADVVAAEDEHAARKIRVARRRSELDEVGRVSYDKMVVARQGLETVYESGSYELAFLTGKTPRAPERLYGQLEQSVGLLKQPAVEPRQPKSKAVSIDHDQVLEDLEPELPLLRGAIDRHARTKKEAEGSLVAKQEAVRNLRRTVVWVGRTTEGLFYLAGEDELAKRIRTSTRRPLRPSEESSEEPAEDSPSESSAEASEESAASTAA